MNKLSLDRILQSQGFGTRRYCRALIEDGDVSIGGAVQDNYKATYEAEGLVALLLGGVQLHDEPAPLAAVTCIKRGEHLLEIVQEQGKYHQVKRMLAAAGNHCAALHRSAIGQRQLDSLGLEEGEWCHLTPEQFTLLGPA